VNYEVSEEALSSAPNRSVTIPDVEEEIRAILFRAQGIVQPYATQILEGPGKRLRPKLLILFSELFEEAEREKVIVCSACCELLHTASLIHDDVVDEAKLRRGSASLNSKFGNQTAVLVGDLILALDFERLTELKDFEILRMTLSCAKELGIGAIEEIVNKANFNLSEETYLRIIANKTGSLFKLASMLGAYLGKADTNVVESSGRYGSLFGQAFQIIDDILDLSVTKQEALKPTFNDLKEGRITLPIIRALETHKEKTLELVEAWRMRKDESAENAIRNYLKETGSFAYSFNMALSTIQKAREELSGIERFISRKDAINELRAIERKVLEQVPEHIRAKEAH